MASGREARWTYPGKPDSVDHREDFQLKLCALFYLRSLMAGHSFYLATNHDDAGSFDNVVLVWRPRTKSKYYGFLIRCIYMTQEPAKDCLFSKKKQFALGQYLTSYHEIKHKWSSLRLTQDLAVPIDELWFVLYTNASIQSSVRGVDYCSIINGVLDTTGRAQWFADDADEIAAKLQKNASQVREFLERFILFHSQSDVYQLESKLKGALARRVGEESAERAYRDLMMAVKDWTRNDCSYLTESYPAWPDTILASKPSTVSLQQSSSSCVSNVFINFPLNMAASLRQAYTSAPSRGELTDCGAEFLEAAATGNIRRLMDLASSEGRYARDSAGNTALHIAAREGHSGAVRLLLEAGLRTEEWNSEVRTPLHLAAANGHAGCLVVLLQKGADQDARGGKSRRTALHYAAEEGRSQNVELLLAKGADVHAEDSDGATALHLAAREGHCGVVDQLLAKGAGVDARAGDGCTPLHRAAEGGCVQVVKLLLRRGASRAATDYHGRTAVSIAEHGRRREVVAALKSSRV